MVQNRLAWWLAVLGIVFVSTASAGCKNTASESAGKDEGATAEAPAAEDDGAGAAAAAPPADGAPAVDPPDDLYPGFQFSLLESDEQARFVEIAKAELCPCPDAAESLHQCMQKDRGARCMLADLVAAEVALEIKKGKNETDILDHVAKFVENYKRVHEFDLAQTPRLGPADAKVVVVEFADFQCPHCAEMSKIVHDAHEKFGDSVAFYFKQFPLSSHEYSTLAAQAALAAHQQGKFWPMHDLLFHNQQALSPQKIEYLAQQVGLNMEKFKQDLNSPAIAAIVRADRAEGEAAQLTGTPTLFINGRRYSGDRAPESVFQALESELKQVETAGAGAPQ